MRNCAWSAVWFHSFIAPAFIQECRQPASYRFQILQLAFPHRVHRPSLSRQRCQVSSVPVLGALQLGQPKVLIRRGHGSPFAPPVAMPEAAVHEDRLAPSREHEVGTTRQVRPMQPVSVSHSVKQSPHAHFRLGSLRLDRRHYSTARLRRNAVNHDPHPYASPCVMCNATARSKRLSGRSFCSPPFNINCCSTSLPKCGLSNRGCLRYSFVTCPLSANDLSV